VSEDDLEMKRIFKNTSDSLQQIHDEYFMLLELSQPGGPIASFQRVAGAVVAAVDLQVARPRRRSV